MKISMNVKKVKKVIGLFMVSAILIGTAGIAGMAQTNNRAANIKSKGIIDFENGAAVIDSSDLTYLADEIDLLEDTYKTETVESLENIGTYFNLDGTYTHNQEESTLASVDAPALAFSSIMNGIINSQSIPTDQTYTGILPGNDTEISGNISGANAANLTLGTAAWVDGKLIVGTGEDNNSYYSQGAASGIETFSIYLSAGDKDLDNSSAFGMSLSNKSKLIITSMNAGNHGSITLSYNDGSTNMQRISGSNSFTPLEISLLNATHIQIYMSPQRGVGSGSMNFTIQ